MPEGDTVWRLAQRLDQALAGSPLTRCDLRVPRLATVDLTGRTVLAVVPRGKHLLTRFEGGLTLHSHLRMDGAWKIYAPAERWRGGPAHQIRAVLGTAAHTAVGYRLPVLELLRTADESRATGHLGPDLLGPDWDPAEALRRLLAVPERPLGEALLDQRNLAGIGNVYKSELCFLLGASPWLPVGRLTAPERAPALARKLLEANKNRPARITTPWGYRPRPFEGSGGARPDRRLWVYGRAGRPCLRCGTPVRTADQDPTAEERITYWCPTCQPPPPAAPPSPSP
ncbi:MULTISPECIES: DNA-formamidopyrimidine glycosylase family protein [unclassified Streptomyces]|uniref:Fpg/Nei family DNA glycosylase n=1 Tax=unclassified Streptomyces TaxID=2593676 RepID=UPI0003777378|nr:MULTISPECIES: DNA-formamidopyrimidine glycosylase family protein [unclassified Streptomyces]MYT29438.1 DNA glycosylase [Streptomyces sp. SID8354]